MFPFLGTFPNSVAYPAYRQNLPIEFNQAYDRLTARKFKYEDTYEKIDGRWWITARDQIFVHREQ